MPDDPLESEGPVEGEGPAEEVDVHKHFHTRIMQKTDTSENWEAQNPVLLRGELAIVMDESTSEGVPPTARMKVGDGTNQYSKLPWVTGAGEGGDVSNKADLVEGKVPKGELPDEIVFQEEMESAIAEVANEPMTETEIEELWNTVFGGAT